MLDCSRIVARSLELPAPRTDVDPRVQQTIDRMERHLHRPMRVTELARAADLSVSQLTRLFRATTGRTPGAFLSDLRMTRARNLVERTSLSVIDVMAYVGISDRSHFARQFRRAHGLSARSLRIQMRRQARRAS